MAQLARVSWQREGNTRALLARLNEGTEPNENGSITFTASDHHELFELLAKQVCFPNDVNYQDASGIAYRAFLNLRKSGLVEQKALISLIARKVENLRKRPSVTFTMWTKCRLQQMPFAKSVRFQFDEVRLRTSSQLPKWLRLETHFISGIGDIFPNKLPFFGYFILTTKARSENEATERIFAALEKFFAVVNTSWRTTETWVSHRPTAAMLHGPNYFFFKERNFIGQDRVWWSQDFNEKDWKSFPKNASSFYQKRDLFRKVLKLLGYHPLKEPLERALVLISEGMMSSRLSFRLMRFWSAAEALYTEENSRTTTEKLLDRMVFAESEDQVPVERLKLRRAYELRNQYVHRGSIEKEDSALIQNLRETILLFAHYILFNGSDFRSHAELIEMIEPSNAPQRVGARLLAIERRRLIVETGRHRSD